MKSFQINSNEAGQRFDKYLKKLLSQAPGSFVYKMLRKKNITLNGKKADGSEKLNIGDEVKLFLSEETFEKFTSFENTKTAFQNQKNTAEKYPCTSLEIIYEDEDILVINKPVGMLSQKAAPGDISANEYIIGYLLKNQSITKEELATFHPSVCNRLDRNTSGLLIAGKSLKGLQDMARQLNDRSMEKYYRCLVKGKTAGEQHIEGWLKKDETSNKVKIYKEEVSDSKYIKTGYHAVEYFSSVDNPKETYTLLEVHLITGRSHQIRAHLASIRHPIVGDSKYGDRKVNRIFAKEAGIHSQMLHAYRMKFADGKEVTAPLSREFQRTLEFLKNS